MGSVLAMAFLLASSVEDMPDEAYTVVWDSPSADSSGSMPLGNGDIGANIWVEENGDIVFYISKTDAWSENARLLKLGRFRVSLTPRLEAGPAFRQTLETRRGFVHIEGGPDEAKYRLRAWIDAHYPALRFEVTSDARCEMTVALEPWRTEPRTLVEVERDSAYGLAEGPDPIIVEPDTIVSGLQDTVAWYHRNERSIWADTLRRQNLDELIATNRDPLLHRTFGGLIRGADLVRVDDTHLRSATPAMSHSFAIYALTAVTDTPEAWLDQVKQLAEKDTVEPTQAFAEHMRWWRELRDRSWIRVTADDDPTDAADISRGYALQRYISACAGRGGSPIKFNGSIFTVDAEVKGQRLDADYRRWGGPYWFQNTRLAYWPMLAAGDFEMMKPLFRMYFDALPFAEARTRAWFGHGGAFFPETMYFWGAYAQDNYGWKREGLSPGVTENTYIRYYYDGALELILLMLRYAEYTGDASFLREDALPFADSILTFYAQHYRTVDGKLRIEPSQALETWQKAVNPAPPIAGLRRVLDELLALPEETTGGDRHQSWQRLRDSLPELPIRETDKGTVLAPAAEVLEEMRNSENAELYAVFPYGLFGVGRPGLDLARRTYDQRPHKGHEGWRQDEIHAATLGLAEEARKGLTARFASKHEGSRFPAFWGPNFDWVPDQDHGGSGMMALQTMLLQPDGKKLYLFPAWPKEWDVGFKLHAPLNTTVEGRLVSGQLVELKVTPEERRADLSVLDLQ